MEMNDCWLFIFACVGGLIACMGEVLIFLGRDGRVHYIIWEMHGYIVGTCKTRACFL